MLAWVEAVIAVLSASSLIILITVLYFLIRRRFSSTRQVVDHTHVHPSPTPPLKTPAATTKRPSYSMFRRHSSTKPGFNWADHPSLIVDAIENGWSRFAFTYYMPSPSLRSSLRRVTGDNNCCNQVELSWEVGQESVDYMQKIRFHNPSGGSAFYAGGAPAVVRTALPLPGPAPSFPQEAYFEIKVVRSGDDDEESSKGGGGLEGENMKLILLKNSCSSSSSTLTGNTSTRRTHVLEEIKLGGARRGGGQSGHGVKISLGFAVGGSPVTSKLPGTYPGSIGFNSDGSVYLAGMKLSYKSEKEDWAQVGKVIGCGFNPNQKKVFFTVNSEVIHVINCKSEDFSMPLYPILTANIDVTLLVNLGQGNFSFAPANAQRTPNPCFVGPITNSSTAALGFDDSRELFSIGRIDVDWLSHNATVRSTVSNEESDVDLFEIVLDSMEEKSGNNEHSMDSTKKHTTNFK